MAYRVIDNESIFEIIITTMPFSICINFSASQCYFGCKFFSLLQCFVFRLVFYARVEFFTFVENEICKCVCALYDYSEIFSGIFFANSFRRQLKNAIATDFPHPFYLLFFFHVLTKRCNRHTSKTNAHLEKQNRVKRK